MKYMKARSTIPVRSRRLLLAGAMALAALHGAAQSGKPTLFLISNSHLDTQWNWDVKTTINDYVHKTMTENMALMDKYPAFLLNYEGAIKYMWMKEYYPAEFERLKSYVASGRWHVSGMSVDAGDVMVSSAESILHSMLYAHRFYRQEFGVRGGRDIMLPDCFGFSYALPALARHAGVRGFHTAKLAWGSASYDRLAPFGVWQGVDGSQIYAIYKPGAYDAHEEFNKDMTTDQETLERARANASAYGVPAVFRYVGPRSDHGGGLQDRQGSTGENTPYWLDLSARKQDGDLNVVLATASTRCGTASSPCAPTAWAATPAGGCSSGGTGRRSCWPMPPRRPPRSPTGWEPGPTPPRSCATRGCACSGSSTTTVSRAPRYSLPTTSHTTSTTWPTSSLPRNCWPRQVPQAR